MLIRSEHAQLYCNELDDSIVDELRRMQLVIRHSLSAYFLYPRMTTQDSTNQLEELVANTILRLEPEKAAKVA